MNSQNPQVNIKIPPASTDAFRCNRLQVADVAVMFLPAQVHNPQCLENTTGKKFSV